MGLSGGFKKIFFVFSAETSQPNLRKKISILKEKNINFRKTEK